MFPLNEMQYSFLGYMLLSQLFNQQGKNYPENREAPQIGNQNPKTPEPVSSFQQTDHKISDERPQKT